jgi:hypothetical protein
LARTGTVVVVVFGGDAADAVPLTSAPETVATDARMDAAPTRLAA